nr:PREDICTED: general odorant-binding protein 71 [Linepithema humile]
MARVILIALCVCLLLVKSAISLKCRSGIQQADDQFRKIVQVCKKRSSGDNSYSDDSSSSEYEDSSEDSSNIDIFDTKFFLSGSGGNKHSNSQSWKDQNNNRNRGNDRRSGNDRRYSFNYTEENAQYPNRGNNNRYFNGAARTSYDQQHNSNSENYKERKQACVIQCFFNELNVVDQRGFPEQDSVTQLVTHNVHNPELEDFLEEAIIECFHYLGSNVRQDNCYFSQNLLTCLTDKGKERCDDWNN